MNRNDELRLQGAWMLPTLALSIWALVSRSTAEHIVGGVVLLGVAALRWRVGSRTMPQPAHADDSSHRGPSDARAGLLKRASSGPCLIAAVRFNEYRALACADYEIAEAASIALLKRLVAAIGPGRSAERVAPDVFAILLDVSRPVAALDADLDSLRYALCQPIEAGGEVLRPTVSIGTAAAPGGTAGIATALERAIGACEGIADTGLGKPIASRPEACIDLELEQQLATAIATGELALHYQPVFDIVAGRVTGAEALMRWHSPTRGDVSPALFVPILERSALIEDAGLWALSTACREARGWSDAGLDLTLAINLSARQLGDDRLIDAVLRTLARNGLPPAGLELELTETAAMAEFGRTQAVFAELRAHGVRLSVDDFGNGYSNLNYLRGLTFDKLKIDRQFVVDIDMRQDSQAICRAIVTLAKGLGLDLIAEGVERPEEADTLRDLGCTLFQGFHFGRPMPASDFLAFALASDGQHQLASPVHRQLAELDQRLAS